MSIINRGDDYFQAGIYTGNGSSQTISGLRFQPDFVWIKRRNSERDHVLVDAVRGSTKVLNSNLTNAEETESLGVTSFNSDGFSLNSFNKTNSSGDTYVYWAWKAGNSNVTNTDGTITSTVRANPTAGFSIVTYTGTGANATVGHGLGVAPSMMIVKQRSGGAQDWAVYHASLGATQSIPLNTTGAAFTVATNWNNTAPTSTVFSVGTRFETNESGATFVAYCFAAIPGYSAFGSYTGNGSTDGPFVFTGFKPALIIRKRTDNIGDWIMMDNKRNTYNLTDNRLLANSSNAEANNGNNIDILSNGWKERNADGYSNASGGTYIYMAFSEVAFKNSLAR
jgi:hypothetical protein